MGKNYVLLLAGIAAIFSLGWAENSKTPTGNLSIPSLKSITYIWFIYFAGYLKIKLKTLTFHTNPDFDNNFESKVRLYIDDAEVFKTSAKQTTASHDFNATYKSNKIPKDSKIKVGVWANGSPFGTVMYHEYSIDELIKNPIYYGKTEGHLLIKSLEMEASWQNA